MLCYKLHAGYVCCAINSMRDMSGTRRGCGNSGGVRDRVRARARAGVGMVCCRLSEEPGLESRSGLGVVSKYGVLVCGARSLGEDGRRGGG